MTSVVPLSLRAATPVPVITGGVGAPQLQINGVHSATTKALDARFIYTPGNERPAVSTSDYYHTHACQYLHPYDLDTMGTPGATVKAANGGRYAWFFSTDHPGGGGGLWRDSSGFALGFTNDPGILPTTATIVIPQNNRVDGSPSIPGTSVGQVLISDFAPSALVYNPDDATFPFYLYTQAVPPVGGTQSFMWKSADLLTWTPGAWTPKNDEDFSVGGLTSHQWVERRGTGNWIAKGTVGKLGRLGAGLWLGTNGKDFDYPSSTFNITGSPSVTLSLSGTTLTASSPIFNSGMIGMGVVVNQQTTFTSWIAMTSGIATGGTNAITITAVPDTTHATLSSNPSGSLSSGAHILEIGPISRRDGPANTLGGQSTYYPNLDGPSYTINGQAYELLGENARHELQPEDDGQYVSLVPVDTQYNVSQTLPTIRISHYAGIYTGQRYLQGVAGYLEDGILHVYVEMGYPGPHATHPAPHVSARTTGSISATTMTLTAVAGFVSLGAMVVTQADGIIGHVAAYGSGTGSNTGTYTITNAGSIGVTAGTEIFINGGTDYNTESSIQSGGFRQQYIEYHTIAIDSLAASRSAPFGVAVYSETNAVVLSWRETALGSGAETQSYNVYRGTSPNPTTFLINVTGTSHLDITPTPGQVWYYKVVKVSNSVEQTTKYREVHIYVG